METSEPAVNGAVTVIIREGEDGDGSPYTLVTPQGALYFDTFQPLCDALLHLAAGEQPRIVLEMSQVNACDSSGLNLLVQTHRLATRQDGWLRLTGVQPNVRRVLELTNLIRILPVCDSVDAALAYVTDP